MGELRLPRDEALEAGERFGKQRRIGRATEGAITILAVGELERMRGASLEVPGADPLLVYEPSHPLAYGL